MRKYVVENIEEFEKVDEGRGKVFENFEEKYKELKIEGKRKRVAETLYIDPEKETYCMGYESEARRVTQKIMKRMVNHILWTSLLL